VTRSRPLFSGKEKTTTGKQFRLKFSRKKGLESGSIQQRWFQNNDNYWYPYCHLVNWFPFWLVCQITNQPTHPQNSSVHQSIPKNLSCLPFCFCNCFGPRAKKVMTLPSVDALPSYPLPLNVSRHETGQKQGGQQAFQSQPSATLCECVCAGVSFDDTSLNTCCCCLCRPPPKSFQSRPPSRSC
jgi:hypothetical protein